MPLADDAPRSAVPVTEPVTAPAQPRSPRIVRGVLAAAALTGLAGLAVTGGGTPAVSALSVAPVSATVLVEEPPALHGPVVLAPAPRQVTKAASRSRTVAKQVVTKKKTTSTSWVRPSYAGIGSYYGMRWGRMHKGLDFNGSTGDAIRAIGAGTVVGSGYLSGESGYGLITIIRHPNGMYSAYAHQSKTYVSSGEKVEAGETIGLIGSTGHSTGSHLHFEIRTAPHGGQVNPLTWLREHGVKI